MPNLTIYVPNDVADGLRRHNVAVSKTCQAALRRKIRMADRGDRVVKNAETGRILGVSRRGSGDSAA